MAGLFGLALFVLCIFGSLVLLNLAIYWLAQGLSKVSGSGQPGCRTFLFLLIVFGLVGVLIAKYG